MTAGHRLGQRKPMKKRGGDDRGSGHSNDEPDVLRRDEIKTELG